MSQTRRLFISAIGVLAATTGLSSTHAHAAAMAANFITEMMEYRSDPPAAPEASGCPSPCSVGTKPGQPAPWAKPEVT